MEVSRIQTVKNRRHSKKNLCTIPHFANRASSRAIQTPYIPSLISPKPFVEFAASAVQRCIASAYLSLLRTHDDGLCTANLGIKGRHCGYLEVEVSPNPPAWMIGGLSMSTKLA